MTSSDYWNRYWRSQRFSRRRVLATTGTGAVGAAGLALVGCGDDDDDNGGTGPTATTPPGTQPTPTPDPDTPEPGGILRTVDGPVGSLLDIHRTNTPFESAGVWHWAGNFLVRFGIQEPHLPEPDLAMAQPEITDDGLTLTFTLNPEAKWQDRAPVSGRAVDAEDVVATFERIKNPETTSPRAGNYSNVESITAIDAQTVQFKLMAPQADLLNAMSDQYDLIIPKEIAERGVNAIQSAADVIGSGPYELSNFEAGQRIQMTKRQDGYWKPNTAWLDGWDVVNQPDNQAKSNALRAGEADYLGLPVDLAAEYENDANFRITFAPNPTRECLLINHNREPYNNPMVRQALSMAINRPQVYELAFSGGGQVGGPMSPAAAPWIIPDEELFTLPGYRDRNTELTEARALLSAAGFPDGFEDSILTVTAFTVDLVNDVIVSNLADIGVRLTTENIGTDFAVFLGREVAREYTLASTLFLSGPYPDAQLYIYHHSTNGSRNYGDYSDPEVDAMLEQQRGIYDYEERRAIVLDIQRKLINEPGPAWIGSRVLYTVSNTRVRNIRSFPFLNGFNGAENVWLKS